jgi:putative endonuclease
MPNRPHAPGTRRGGFVYIMSNAANTVLYIGTTSDLERRVTEHKTSATEGFTSRYRCTKLVYVEQAPTMAEAIVREKQIKEWKREWKNELIDRANPKRHDLAAFLDTPGTTGPRGAGS